MTQFPFNVVSRLLLLQRLQNEQTISFMNKQAKMLRCGEQLLSGDEADSGLTDEVDRFCAMVLQAEGAVK